jgi:hypothetical protein
VAVDASGKGVFERMNKVFDDIGLLLWFIRQRVQELAILIITVAVFYFYQAYVSPFVPVDTPLPADMAMRYVVPYAELAFAFAIVVQISVIVWVSALSPRSRSAAWRT